MEQVLGVLALAVIIGIGFLLVRKLRKDNPGGIFGGKPADEE